MNWSRFGRWVGTGRGLLVALIVGLLLAGSTLPVAAQGNDTGQRVYALTAGNRLISFDPNHPSRILSYTPIKGLAAHEWLVGIDFRPANSKLYGVGSTSRVYTIELGSGQASAVGAPFTPALAGSAFGVDFNPAADRLRVVSNTGQNLRINPDTGVVAGVDTALNFAASGSNAGRTPRVVGAAYTNNKAGATSTLLYDIDSALDILVTQTPPNAGTLNTIGALGVKANDVVGFDITTANGRDQAFASLRVRAPHGWWSASRFYSVDLTTGKVHDRGRIGFWLPVRDIAIPIGMAL